MPVSVEKLLVLKSYYLGHAISEKKIIFSSALEMIDAAIDFLQSKTDRINRRRYFFYILLKSEVLRGTEESIEYRKKAQELSHQIDSYSLYKDFMSIEAATQSKHKSHGWQKGIIGNRGVEHKKQFVYFTYMGPEVGVYDSALRALDLDEKDLSEKERRFLFKVNLKELLEKHNVPFSF